MKRITILLLLLALLGSVAVAGDTPTTGKIAKYIWVQTEQYQPGKQAAYMKLGQVFKETMANSEFVWLAGMPLAGNGNEVAYVTFHDSYASMEKMVAAFEKIGPEMHQKNAAVVSQGMDAVATSQAYMAEFKPELSVAPETVPLPQITRWRIVTFRIKPGMAPRFAELLKEIRGLHEKAGDNLHTLVYSVVAGEPSPGYIVVLPLKTLADLDEPPSKAIEELLTPIMRQHISTVVKDTVADSHAAMYMVDPRLSLPPKSYLAENPGFWQVKEPAPVVATGKKAKKVTEPAALKEKEKK